jgi:hypothetical protein
MPYAPKLPPVAHVHFPVPIFEPDLSFPSQDLERSTTTRIENLEESIPQPTYHIPVTHDVGSALSQLRNNGIIRPNVRSEPSKHSTPENVQSKSGKVMFSFVEVRESSGKLNTATSSHVRSVVMRKHHEKRRSLNRPAKNRHRPIAISCNHKHPTSDNACENFITFHRPHFDPLPAGAYFLTSSNRKASSQETELNRETGQGTRTVATSDAVCAQCGWVLHQTPLNRREKDIVKHIAGPRTLLDNNLGDPFDSASISLTPRMRELAYHCKISQACYFPFSFHASRCTGKITLLTDPLTDFFQQASATNPHIYHQKGQGHVYSKVLDVTRMMFDAACLNVMASVAGFVLLQFKQKSILVMDCNARDDLKSCRSEANYYLSQGARLLNEKLRDPKEALSNTSMITAALLGICSV